MSAAMAQTVRLELPFATQRNQLTVAELQEGVIGTQAREMFSFGYCHYLASALHEATGWRLAVMQQAAAGCRWRWVHTAVQAGYTQQLLDISGVQERTQIRCRYASYGGPFRWVEMGWHEFTREIGLKDGPRPSWWRDTRIGRAAGDVICSYVAQLAEQAREWDALS